MALGKKGIALKALFEAQGAAAACAIISAAIEKKELRPSDFSLRETAEAILGENFIRAMEGDSSGGLVLLEGGAGVDSSAFSNITGQIVFAAMMEGYKQPDFVGDQVSTTIKTPFFDGEKIPGITAPRGDIADIGEGMPYPEAGLAEDYVTTPATVKNGLIVSVTKEAIAKDRTGLIIDRAQKVGERVGFQKEVKILKVVTGIVNNHSWKGTSYNTFLTSGGWINDKSGVTLSDWTSLEDVLVQMADIANPDQPDSTEPLPFSLAGGQVLVMPYNAFTINRIISATEIRTGNAATNTTIASNPVSAMGIKPVVSSLAYQLLQRSGISAANAKHYWYAGQLAKAVAYMENWPLTVVQAAQNSEAEFERDVVLRFKASERGQAVMLDPRKLARRYNG